MSQIEWTDETWNPTVGCSPVSTGCERCYAARVSARGLSKEHRGLTVPNVKIPRWTGEVRTLADRLSRPLSWRKPRRVFVDSMSDLFHEDIPEAFLDQVFGVMLACGLLSNRRHTFQVLTKRPERMAKYLGIEDEVFASRRLAMITRWANAGNDSVSMDNEDLLFSEFVDANLRRSWSGEHGTKVRDPKNLFPLRNVWLGTSCENQPTLDERLPHLMATPAAVRFLSLEPLLGPIVLPGYAIGLDWVIVGGESGPGARPCWVDAIGRLVEQCAGFGIPVFVKQLGARPYRVVGHPDPDCNCREFACDHRLNLPAVEWLHLISRKGNDVDEWPEGLRVREFPK